jgi:hypothetical protein
LEDQQQSVQKFLLPFKSSKALCAKILIEILKLNSNLCKTSYCNSKAQEHCVQKFLPNLTAQQQSVQNVLPKLDKAQKHCVQKFLSKFGSSAAICAKLLTVIQKLSSTVCKNSYRNWKAQ